MRRAPRAVSLLVASTVAFGGLALPRADGVVPVAPAPPGSAPVLVGPPAPSPSVPLDGAPSESPTELTPPPPEPLPAPSVAYQRRYNMAIIGGGLLLATWGADRLLTRDFSPDYEAEAWVPIVGPWFLLHGQTKVAAPNKFTMSLLVFDGLLQAGGLTVGILGLVLHKKRLTMSLPPVPPRAAP